MYPNDNDDGWWWIKGTVIDLFFLSSVCQGSYEYIVIGWNNIFQISNERKFIQKANFKVFDIKHDFPPCEVTIVVLLAWEEFK